MPQFILDEAISKGAGGSTNIIVTQPRRISALGLAQRVAQERAEPVSVCLLLLLLLFIKHLMLLITVFEWSCVKCKCKDISLHRTSALGLAQRMAQEGQANQPNNNSPSLHLGQGGWLQKQACKLMQINQITSHLLPFLITPSAFHIHLFPGGRRGRILREDGEQEL